MTPPSKSIARSVGEFLGHIWHAVKSDPAGPKREVRRTVETEERDGLILRRTTIEEVELKPSQPPPSTSSQ